jgi:hypothetical protein
MLKIWIFLNISKNDVSSFKKNFFFEHFNISKSNIISVKAANLLGYAKSSITLRGIPSNVTFSILK